MPRGRLPGTLNNGFPTLAAAFWSQVDLTGEHWLWLGARNGSYGTFRGHPAHHWPYFFIDGEFPTGIHAHHTCPFKLCIRHTEKLTPSQHTQHHNTTTRKYASRTHCPRGHSYPEHLFVSRNGRKRECRLCKHRAEEARRKRRS